MVCFAFGAGGADPVVVEVGALVVGTGGVVVVVVLLGAVVVLVVEEEEEEEEETLACATNGQSAVAVTASSSTRMRHRGRDHERTDMSYMSSFPSLRQTQPVDTLTGPGLERRRLAPEPLSPRSPGQRRVSLSSPRGTDPSTIRRRR